MALALKFVDCGNTVIEIRSLIEASIEFDDEIQMDILPDSIADKIIVQVIPALQELVSNYQSGRLLREGLRVVLAGKPNVGKSSLMNQLLKQDRVIVSEVPGTTRDTIEEGIEIDGIPILICDTAGLADSKDPIDRIGQKRTQEAIEKADLILFMIDGSQPIDDSDRALSEFLGKRFHIVLRNKIDLVQEEVRRTRFKEMPAEGYLDISALNGLGLDRLKERVLLAAGVDKRAEAEACLPNLRQKMLLTRALSVLSGVLDQSRVIEDFETLAIDLRDCERYFNQILGDDVEQDVLDEIFNRFCIGK